MGSHELEFADPLEVFAAWMKQAEVSEVNDANAAALATATSAPTSGGKKPSKPKKTSKPKKSAKQKKAATR